MKVVHDPALGKLERRRGKWRRMLELGHEKVPLVLAGGRSGPDPEAVAVAQTAVGQLAAWRSIAEPALREHRSNGTDIAQDADVWTDVTSVYVAVIPIDRLMTIEWGLRVGWDEEHTLGARLRGGELVELNGSVLAP
jgi:hypothetical protein